MDAKMTKRNNDRIKRKRKNEGMNRRKDALVKKAYEFGEFDGVDVALIICKHGRYTTYKSNDHTSWPPSMAKIQTAYPLPKNVLPQDVEKHSSKNNKEIELPRKDEGDRRVIKERTSVVL